MDYDIVIVGGGPAGVSTALHLQQVAPALAARTLVLERDRHPREKLCAGGLVRDGEKVLRRLGLDVGPLPHVPVRRGHLLFQGRGFTLNPNPFFFRDFKRMVFDHWLADAARTRGIALQEDTQVLDIVRRADGMEIHTRKGTIKAKVVIGADGSNSVVRRFVTGTSDTRMARTLEIIIPPAPEAREVPPAHDEAIFDFSVISDGVQGYLWKFPMFVDGKPTWNYGIFDTRIYKRTPHADLQEVFSKRLAQQGLDLKDYKVKGHPIRYFTPESKVAAERVLLAGDAAGVCSLFGEGISQALAYGQFAANELKDAFERNDLSFAGYRDRLVRSKMGQSLLRRYRIAQALYAFQGEGAQRLLWWQLTGILKWVVRNQVFDWAES